MDGGATGLLSLSAGPHVPASHALEGRGGHASYDCPPRGFAQQSYVGIGIMLGKPCREFTEASVVIQFERYRPHIPWLFS